MALPILGYTNRVLAATLTAGSSASGLGPENVQDPHGCAASGWQTAAGVLTPGGGAYLRIDAGASATWRAFLLARTNLSASAQVRWRVSANSDLSSPVYDSGTITAGIVAGFGQSLVLAGAAVSGRYCGVDITDSSNPDNLVNIPHVYAGPVWQPSRGLSYASSKGRERSGSDLTTRGGQKWKEPFFSLRRFDIALDNVAAADVGPELEAMEMIAELGTNILFCPDPDDDPNRATIFGDLVSLSDITYPYQSTDFRAWRGRISERL